METIEYAYACKNHKYGSIASRHLHIEHGARRQRKHKQEGSGKGTLPENAFGGRRYGREFYTERDTDFAPLGRNNGTTVIRADVKFMFLWHKDEFKLYI